MPPCNSRSIITITTIIITIIGIGGAVLSWWCRPAGIVTTTITIIITTITTATIGIETETGHMTDGAPGNDFEILSGVVCEALRFADRFPPLTEQPRALP